MSKKKWLGTWPARCQLCHIELQTLPEFYDARLYNGRWGLMCKRCFIAFGVGLGLGRGQRYSTETLEKTGG